MKAEADGLFAGDAITERDRRGLRAAEHRKPGAYSPYGRGRHVCLGKTLADIQMLVTMARLFHRRDLSLDSPDHRARTRARPTRSGSG